MLTVNGNIHARQVNIDVNIPAPDYVFDKRYKLKSLTDVSKYIIVNKHLPEIPSAKAMEKNGINVSDLNMKLLQKIEELTLYLIEKDKAMKAEAAINNSQSAEIARQKSLLVSQQDEINLLKDQMAQIAKKLK